MVEAMACLLIFSSLALGSAYGHGNCNYEFGNLSRGTLGNSDNETNLTMLVQPLCPESEWHWTGHGNPMGPCQPFLPFDGRGCCSPAFDDVRKTPEPSTLAAFDKLECHGIGAASAFLGNISTFDLMPIGSGVGVLSEYRSYMSSSLAIQECETPTVDGKPVCACYCDCLGNQRDGYTENSACFESAFNKFGCLHEIGKAGNRRCNVSSWRKSYDTAYCKVTMCSARETCVNHYENDRFLCQSQHVTLRYGQLINATNASSTCDLTANATDFNNIGGSEIGDQQLFGHSVATVQGKPFCYSEGPGCGDFDLPYQGPWKGSPTYWTNFGRTIRTKWSTLKARFSLRQVSEDKKQLGEVQNFLVTFEKHQTEFGKNGISWQYSGGPICATVHNITVKGSAATSIWTRLATKMNAAMRVNGF